MKTKIDKIFIDIKVTNIAIKLLHYDTNEARTIVTRLINQQMEQHSTKKKMNYSSFPPKINTKNSPSQVTGMGPFPV